MSEEYRCYSPITKNECTHEAEGAIPIHEGHPFLSAVPDGHYMDYSSTTELPTLLAIPQATQDAIDFYNLR